MSIQVPTVVPTFLAESGLTVFTPVSSPDFSIQGSDSQIVTIACAPGQSIQAEPGAMCFASNEMKQQTKLGGITRWISGEQIFKAKWTNQGSAPGYVALTNSIPSTIIPINLDGNANSILCSRNAFLASINPDVRISIGILPTDSCLACFCSGLTPIMQSVKGNGWVFLAAHGTIVQKILAPGEEIVVDTQSVVACGHSVTVDIRRTGGCCTMCCSGEGIFNTSLKGPGMVIMCSLPLSKMRRLFYGETNHQTI